MPNPMPATPQFIEACQLKYDVLHTMASTIVADGQEHMPLMCVFTTRGEVIIVPLTGLPSKDLAAVLHQKLGGEVSLIDTVATIKEAWKKVLDKGEKQPEGSLEHVEGRTECIMFNFIRGGQQLVALCDIDREANKLAKADLIDPTSEAMRGREILGTSDPLN